MHSSPHHIVKAERWRGPDIAEPMAVGNKFADAEFIAHARTDLPAALDEIERLTSLLCRVAGPAVNYDSRVYRLTDDFTALLPYLSRQDIERAGRRGRQLASSSAGQLKVNGHGPLPAVQAGPSRISALHTLVPLMSAALQSLAANADEQSMKAGTGHLSEEFLDQLEADTYGELRRIMIVLGVSADELDLAGVRAQRR